jgi:hypothetical protein
MNTKRWQSNGLPSQTVEKDGQPQATLEINSFFCNVMQFQINDHNILYNKQIKWNSPKSADFREFCLFSSNTSSRVIEVILTCLKWWNLGIFQFVRFERRQPVCIFRIKICAKFRSFQVRRIFYKLFFVSTRQKRSIYWCICKAFNAVMAEKRR